MYCPNCPNNITMVGEHEYTRERYWRIEGVIYTDMYREAHWCPICGTLVETSIPVTITAGEQEVKT